MKAPSGFRKKESPQKARQYRKRYLAKKKRACQAVKSKRRPPCFGGGPVKKRPSNRRPCRRT